MLEPADRQLLLDCLRPPNGYALDHAVGTTYSLDLYALLSVPVAFVFRDAMSEDGQADPLATLEGLRRYAAHVHLFCQAGEIHVPRGQQRLFAYLEDSVIPVVPPDQAGVFHPKCWLLRFIGAEDNVAYRFVCLSRNLTFDRSWDTALVLDGVLEAQRVREPDARPLARFVEALPGLARVAPREATRTAVQRMAEELPRVRFECPPGVEAMRFWPMGVGTSAAPDFAPARRPLLIVSPFVSEAWLRQHAAKRQRACLVSREEQLLELTHDTWALFDEHYTFLQQATPEADVEAQAEDENLLDGLHAKLFVMDDGWQARVWTGSANATSAAFHHNVELLVELIGRRKDLGVNALLGEGNGEAAFRDLLLDWQPPVGEIDEPDALVERLDERLREVRRALANADLMVAAAAADGEGLYPLTINGDWPILPEGVTGTVRPIGLEPERAREITGEAVSFGPVTLEALSAFVAVKLTAREAGCSRQARFVLRLPLDGAPADRGSRLLRAMLADRSEFMRLLMILLADEGVELMVNTDSGGDARAGDWLAGGSDTPLLESLLKTLDRSPERLDEIQRLLDDIGESGELDELLPEGFLAVWEAVWANRPAARYGA